MTMTIVTLSEYALVFLDTQVFAWTKFDLLKRHVDFEQEKKSNQVLVERVGRRKRFFSCHINNRLRLAILIHFQV
jgi:hypothetical protein